MPHLRKTLIGAVVVAGLALTGCGTSGGFHSSSNYSMDENPTMGYSQENVQRFDVWFNGNIDHEWWDVQVVFHPEANLYFDPYTQLYYFEADGTWNQSQYLPTNIRLLRSTRQIADRREVLSKSGNAEYVMAFNPDFVPFIEDVSPLFEAADGSLDYSDYYQSDSLSHVDNK